jgi:hypothetical protein
MLVVACGTACTSTSGTVVVRAMTPGTQAPLSGLQLTVLPVDAQAILDTLARGAITPKPTFPALEQAMRTYRLGSVAPSGDSSADHTWQGTRDSVEALADTLRHLERASLAYRQAYDRLRGLYDRLSQRSAARDRAHRGTEGGVRDLALQAARAADSLRRWENAAYSDFPDHMRQAIERTGRDVVQQTVDSSGQARLKLPSGDWWIEARLTDPENPFEEYFWNLPVHITSLAPAIVPLAEWTARRRWRH